MTGGTCCGCSRRGCAAGGQMDECAGVRARATSTVLPACAEAAHLARLPRRAPSPCPSLPTRKNAGEQPWVEASSSLCPSEAPAPTHPAEPAPLQVHDLPTAAADGPAPCQPAAHSQAKEGRDASRQEPMLPGPCHRLWAPEEAELGMAWESPPPASRDPSLLCLCSTHKHTHHTCTLMHIHTSCTQCTHMHAHTDKHTPICMPIHRHTHAHSQVDAHVCTHMVVHV